MERAHDTGTAGAAYRLGKIEGLINLRIGSTDGVTDLRVTGGDWRKWYWMDFPGLLAGSVVRVWVSGGLVASRVLERRTAGGGAAWGVNLVGLDSVALRRLGGVGVKRAPDAIR